MEIESKSEEKPIYKELVFHNFLTSKIQLQSIKHRKIVQIIVKKYCPLKRKYLVEKEGSVQVNSMIRGYELQFPKSQQLVPIRFHNIKNISVEYSRFQLRPKTLRELGLTLNSLRSLKKLKLKFNNYDRLGQRYWVRTVQSIGKLTQLQELELFFGKDQVCGQGIELFLADSIGMLKSLQRIDLKINSWNCLETEHFRQILQKIQELKQLMFMSVCIEIEEGMRQEIEESVQKFKAHFSHLKKENFILNLEEEQFF